MISVIPLWKMSDYVGTCRMMSDVPQQLPNPNQSTTRMYHTHLQVVMLPLHCTTLCKTTVTYSECVGALMTHRVVYVCYNSTLCPRQQTAAHLIQIQAAHGQIALTMYKEFLALWHQQCKDFNG